jgi:hypothetical protein
VVELCGAMQKIYVSMATVATIGHYGIYVALPQGLVDGPGIADVPFPQKTSMTGLACLGYWWMWKQTMSDEDGNRS